MQINSDHYFTGKSRHKPCEDYAFSGLTPVPHILVSDGCSSSPGSHIGSMLLTLAARQQIHRLEKNCVPDYRAFGDAVIRRAARFARPMDLPSTALDATLLMAVYLNKTVHVYVWGDGFVAARRRDTQEFRHMEIVFTTNAPFYLSYGLNHERRQHYDRTLDLPKIIYTGSGETQLLRYDDPVFYEFAADEFSCVMLASDGVSSFMDAEKGKPVDSGEILRDLAGFRNFNGEFVKRRARRAVNDREKRSQVNTDDLSVAAIYMLEDEP